jgi:hypothetical protein
MKVEGTTNTGTEVQVATESLDAELTAAFVAALTVANERAEDLIFSMVDLAGSIIDLHEQETWTRTIDEATGAIYTSAKAYYRSIADGFPHLNKVLRDPLCDELYGGKYEDKDLPGVNELAELVHCHPSQVTRSSKKAKAALEAKLAEEQAAIEAAARSEAVEEVAAEAAAAAATEAAEAGLSDAEIEAAAEAAAKAATKAAQAVEAATAAKAAKAAEAEAAATEATKKAAADSKALKTLENAITAVADRRPDMKPEDRAAAIKLVEVAAKAWAALDLLESDPKAAAAKAAAEREAKEAAALDALAAEFAAEVEAAEAPVAEAPVADAPKPGGRSRKAATA